MQQKYFNESGAMFKPDTSKINSLKRSKAPSPKAQYPLPRISYYYYIYTQKLKITIKYLEDIIYMQCKVSDDIYSLSNIIVENS